LILLSTHAGGSCYVKPGENRLDRLLNPKGDTVLDKIKSSFRTCIATEKVEKLWSDLEKTVTSEKTRLTPRCALEGQLSAYLAFDRSRKKTFDFPVLIASGDSDPLTPPENSINLSALIVKSKLFLLNDCEHLVDVERPDELSQLINDFIGGTL
jgi:pimeloyl-ACP methyl ester carboxylesterase